MNKSSSNLSILRAIALVLLFVGAAGSMTLMFNAGSKQNSIFLIVLFTGWVISPFVALLLAELVSKPWTLSIRTRLYWLMIFVPIVSLIGYSGVINLPGTKTAFKFLIVPLISLALIFVIIPLGSTLIKRISRKTRNID